MDFVLATWYFPPYPRCVPFPRRIFGLILDFPSVLIVPYLSAVRFSVDFFILFSCDFLSYTYNLFFVSHIAFSLYYKLITSRMQDNPPTNPPPQRNSTSTPRPPRKTQIPSLEISRKTPKTRNKICRQSRIGCGLTGFSGI